MSGVPYVEGEPRKSLSLHSYDIVNSSYMDNFIFLRSKYLFLHIQLSSLGVGSEWAVIDSVIVLLSCHTLAIITRAVHIN